MPHLANIPVYNLSLGYNDLADYAKLGDLSGASDYANAHAYVSTSSTPGASLQMSSASPTPASSGTPVVITETGYTTQSDTPYLGASENVQAKSILNTLADAFKGGVGTTYLYQLLDAGCERRQQRSRDQFRPVQRRRYAEAGRHRGPQPDDHSGDDGTGGRQPTAQLDYSLDNMPDTGNSMVLGKSNGAYELVIWAEPRSGTTPPTPKSQSGAERHRHLGSVHQSISVYDPLEWHDPDRDLHRRQRVHRPAFRSSRDHRNRRPGVVRRSKTFPPTVSGTAVEIVVQLSDLERHPTSLQTITLTDTHMLPVASEATMNYIISHYGEALSAIQGGYSFSVTTSDEHWSVTKVFDAAAYLQSTTTPTYIDGVITSKVDGVCGRIDRQHPLHRGRRRPGGDRRAADGSKNTKTFDVNGKSRRRPGRRTRMAHPRTRCIRPASRPRCTSPTPTAVMTTPITFTGQNYTTQTQHYRPTGKVTSVDAGHADGSLAYTQTITGDGTKVTTLYDSTGHKTTVIAGTSSATITDQYDMSGQSGQADRPHADGALRRRSTPGPCCLRSTSSIPTARRKPSSTTVPVASPPPSSTPGWLVLEHAVFGRRQDQDVCHQRRRQP